MSEYAEGAVRFDIRVLSEGVNTSGFVMKVDCFYPCSSGDQAIGNVGLEGWQTVQVPVSSAGRRGAGCHSRQYGSCDLFPPLAKPTGWFISSIMWSGVADDTPPVQAQVQLVF